MEKNAKVLKIGRDVRHGMLNNIVKAPSNPSGAFAAILKIKSTQLVFRKYLASSVFVQMPLFMTQSPSLHECLIPE